jgi:hypothetical protein
VNDTYKVESGHGDTYFLRIYSAGWRSRDEIATEIAGAILGMLAVIGAEAAAASRGADGQIKFRDDTLSGSKSGSGALGRATQQMPL